MDLVVSPHKYRGNCPINSDVNCGVVMESKQIKLSVILKAEVAVEIDISEDVYNSSGYGDLAMLAREKANLDSSVEWEFETLSIVEDSSQETE